METSGQLSFASTLLPVLLVIFVIAIGVVLLTQQFRKNLYRQKLQQEELKNRHQRELLLSSIEVQETERKRIAQDMHDELGAALSITRMHLVQLEKRLGGADQKNITSLQDIRNLVDTSLTNMRRISHELMPPQLEAFGLVKTLEAVASQINKSGELGITVKAASLPELNWQQQLGIYRVCMELVNNTLKHAQASQIAIELKQEQNNLVVFYADNGRGLPPGIAGKGLGHKGMEGRVTSLGGIIEVGNRDEGGLYALIKIPV